MRAVTQSNPYSATAGVAFKVPARPTSNEPTFQAQQILQTLKENEQIAEAEAVPEPGCGECASASSGDSGIAPAISEATSRLPAKISGLTFRTSVNEVTLLFAATDHGKSVPDLTASDLEVLDDSHPPEAIVGFRNESQLPLRLGLVIDTSQSVTDRLSFEEAAAGKFLKQVVTGKDDLAFVVGVNNSVFLVQDFTADQALATSAVSQLAPGGGTALWDAVGFAADKLARRPEVEPVARILVVISDGEDNSSSVSLKQAITTAQRGEVAVYTISTRDNYDWQTGVPNVSDPLGDRALKALSELTGGSMFRPGSVRGLNGSLVDLQQVIRSRYLISYKPASFRRNGRYHKVDLTAQKAGRKLKVFARKGYYASVAQPDSTDQ